MSEEKQPLITRNFLKHLTRGGIKAIPIAGALIDEMIFGTLEGEDRAAESSKLASTLASIQARVDEQSSTLEQVLIKTNAEAGLKPAVTQEIAQLVSAVKSPDMTLLPPSLDASVEHLLSRHNISMAEAENNPNVAFERLQKVVSNIGTAQEMDRAKFVNWLYGLQNDDLQSLILNISGANNRITESASVRRRVNELIAWADSSTGPGLAQVYRSAQSVGLFPR